MAGVIKRIIDLIIETRAGDNQALINLTKTKLMLQGINPDKYSYNSEDDVVILRKLERIAASAGVDVCALGNERLSIITASSVKPTVEEAVLELYSKLKNFNSSFILFFASPIYQPELLSKKMKDCFENVEIIGCTTAGEIESGKMLKNSIVAMAFSNCIISGLKVEVVNNLSKSVNLNKAFSSFEQKFNTSSQDMDNSEYFGLILIDGLSKSEEKVMDKIGDMTHVYFIGGAAGDYMNFRSTYVFANGESYTDAAVLALVKPCVHFKILNTQSFALLDKKLVATNVDEKNRKVIEFDGKPAVDAYADVLGIDKSDLEKYFIVNPLGLMINNEIFVRSPQRIEGSSIIFYCNIYQNTELTLLTSTSIVDVTQGALSQVKSELGKVSGIINFNCILRTLKLEDEGNTEKYADIFKGIPTVGFSTYGEEYISHVNQTSTMIVFSE